MDDGFPVTSRSRRRACLARLAVRHQQRSLHAANRVKSAVRPPQPSSALGLVSRADVLVATLLQIDPLVLFHEPARVVTGDVADDEEEEGEEDEEEQEGEVVFVVEM